MSAPELLAPAGNFQRLKTALHFGADAVYLAGKSFGLRAFSDNFTDEGLQAAVNYAHERGKKVYVAVNVFARNADFDGLAEHLRLLEEISADAAIVSDPGVLRLAQTVAPRLPLHLSTQANTTNRYAAAFWADCGVSRIVLARELSLAEIAEIRQGLPDSVELEVFVHGAMCISYSGRCLLSDYLAGRPSNRGACAQACRWEYRLTEAKRGDEPLTLQEDDRGTYFLNSRDLCLLGYLGALKEGGVSAFKIEGRMKSEYYVATVVNAYRRAMEGGMDSPPDPRLFAELEKCGHRSYTTGFLLGGNPNTRCLDSGKQVSACEFSAVVLGYDAESGLLEVEQRNRFRAGDTLEVLSPRETFNREIKVERMYDAEGALVTDARLVQQRLFLPCRLALRPLDILRKKTDKPGILPGLGQ